MAFRFTSRQWFWGLLCTAGVWCIAGYHFDNDVEHPRWMRKTQDKVIAPLPLTTLVVGEAIFKGIEGLGIAAIERVSPRRPDQGQTIPELRDQIENLEARIQLLQSKLSAIVAQNGALARLGPVAEDAVEASVLGASSSPGASRIHLDKGSTSGVAPNMPVIAPLEQGTVLGRVITVNQLDCEAILFTDARMKVYAEITHGQARVTTEPILVEGLGGNDMRNETVDVDRPNLPAPQKGDFVLLADQSFPPLLQGFPIGRIQEVTRRENQAKRYDIRIAPLRPMTALHTVMIVTK